MDYKLDFKKLGQKFKGFIRKRRGLRSFIMDYINVGKRRIVRRLLSMYSSTLNNSKKFISKSRRLITNPQRLIVKSKRLLNKSKRLLLTNYPANHKPHVNISVSMLDDKSAFDSIRKIISQIAGSHGEIDVQNLAGGTTNILFECAVPRMFSKEPEVMLVRVYGANTEEIIDRDYEIELLKALEQQKLRPKLFGTFDNGCVFEFLPGNTLKAHDMRNEDKSEMIAKSLSKWHSAELPGERIPILWNRFDNWLGLAQEGGDEILPNGYTWETISNEVQTLKNYLEELHSPCVASHNDLTAGNLIYDPDLETVSFIDFEYSGYNYRGFDIGNLFCEWAGLDLDFTKYPTKEEQLHFLRCYLEAGKSREKLEEVYNEVNAFSLASHLLWGIWALVQTQHSKINFDYIGYSSKRFQEYFKRKSELEALMQPMNL